MAMFDQPDDMTAAFDPATIDRRVLLDLIGGGSVDCGQIVQIVQLMVMPEFDAFFAALCHIDLGRAEEAATSLAATAETMLRKEVAVADAVQIALGRGRNGLFSR